MLQTIIAERSHFAIVDPMIALGGDMSGVRTMRTMHQALEYCLRALADSK